MAVSLKESASALDLVDGMLTGILIQPDRWSLVILSLQPLFCEM